MGVSSARNRVDEFREALAAGVFTADGAMGTMLASRLIAGGSFSRRCLDELNLSLPALVRDVHQEFLRAGARIAGTNTFGANRARLGTYGFEGKVRAINQAGVRIAREAALGFEAFVAGVAGPLGVRLEPLGLTTRLEARALFREQIDALLASGVDLLMLETFQDLGELEEAILAARESAGPEIVIVGQVSVEEDGSLACGASVREFTRRLNAWPVDVIGVNCSSGPAAAIETIGRMAEWTNKPLSAAPNAGLPATVNGQTIYPCSPEYMAESARRLLQTGVRILGGCCGTTPEHIRGIRAVVDASGGLSGRAVIQVDDRAAAEEFLEILPAASRSRLGARLAAGEFVTIVEMPPPHGSDGSKEVAAAIESCPSGVDCISVSDRPSGKGRMSAIAGCHLLQRVTGMECALEITGRAGNTSSWRTALLDAFALGVRNVSCGVDAIGLTAAIARMKQTPFLAGVVVDPSAPDLEEELRRFELQVKSGADYLVTRPVFDLDLLDEFLNRIEPHRLPVVVGIRRLRSSGEAEFLINERRVKVPPDYLSRLAEGGELEGLAIAQEMVDRLRGRVAGIQYR